jgi:hypothetical protein
MINKILLIFFIIISLTFAQNDRYQAYRTTSFAIGTQFGMYNGVGGNLSILSSQFADNFPFTAKLSVGLAYSDAGDPLAARRIFINNNTNGIPEKSGKTWNFSLDFLRRYSILNLKRNYFYAGPRYIMFTGNFNFIGGNEDFDVTSDQWGLGVGMENYFRIVPAIDLVINFGYDYYFSSTLYGHDTSYSPEGQDVNPREDYTFDDADRAVNQPQHQIKALIGFNYNFN